MGKRQWTFIVFVDLDEDEPPGDQCEEIRAAMEAYGFSVDDVGWEAQFPTINKDPIK